MNTDSNRRAVFLDRDGVINRAVVRDGKPFPPGDAAEFELIGGVEEACRKLDEAGFLLVIVTNQPDVGRGTQKREIVEDIHRRILERLPINRIEVSYASGETFSRRRKPAPGMIYDAAEKLGIDVSRSFMVGDRWRDIDAGRAAGCGSSILIDYGYDESLNCEPDFRVGSLAEAADLILRLETENPEKP